MNDPRDDVRARAGLALAIAALIGASVGGAACKGGDTGGGGTTHTSSHSGGGGTGGVEPLLCDAADDTCSDGKSCCDSLCTDTDSDPKNCGSCGGDCGEPDIINGVTEVACTAGHCDVTCTAGRGDCDLLATNGCEADFSVDVINCGMCGKVCLFANAVPGCDNAQCVITSCKGGFDDCDKDVANGCESDLSNDPSNCNACGNPCAAAPNAQPYCTAGQCAPGPCLPGFADCDGDPANGCEVDLFNDAVNCGSCGFACAALPHAGTACVGGACAVGTCDAGHDDCDHSVWSGCESDLDNDTKNCSACGNVCPLVDHGYPGCKAAACGVAGCDPGFDDCDKAAGNGCEVNLANDGMNCGACGNACPPVANGAAVCTGYECRVGSCQAPFADCFSGLVDGCETNLLTAVDHCGDCATVCPGVANGSRACNSGTCGIGTCATGYRDCNTNAGDGCEVNTTNDVNNCGSCGNVCPTPAHGVAGCVSGQCVLAGCQAGFSDCDSQVAGCEAATASNANNCGGCGIKCGSGTCMNSACVCNKGVLLLIDDSPAAALTPLINALTAAGYTVNSTVKSYQYTGTPALTGTAFGAVVVLGGTNGAAATTDMPSAAGMNGQQAIVDFVLTQGNGVVFTEWAALHVANNQWLTLKQLVLLGRTGAFTGVVTYTVDSAFAGHPLWAGLPGAVCSVAADCPLAGATCTTGHCSGTFKFNSSTNVGITNIAAGVTRVASSPQAIDGVALMNRGAGRAVHVSHAGNYNTSNGWSDAAVLKLMVNAVGWAARCK